MSDTRHNNSGINPNFSLVKRKIKNVDYYLRGLQEGNRFILSECITLLESNNKSKRILGESVMERLPPISENTLRLGVTGSPGVGKSTFIESFGLFLISKNHHPAILAIDPSSQSNKGSILGDKTRMNELSGHEKAYIRPSPSGAILGGTGAFTKEAIQLCEACGFDTIIIETVGVGQSETEVDHITDVNILLLQPGAGDDIQGIKRGIVENADIFVINKADGPQLDLAKHTRSSYKNAVQLFHHDIPGWTCPVILTSALEKRGLDNVYSSVTDFLNLLKEKNILTLRRNQQEIRWFENQVLQKLQEIAFKNDVIKTHYSIISEDLKSGKIKTNVAISKMVELFKSVIFHN
ncbi:MAG: methylmalonyl Co-A mutase-associated GTPase MeaB [Saprospiraceae bacterium]|nr:methylmalonyl Co-A mutase-associated GTPase MeaB [Saprospiraceae bacterium]